MTMTAQVGREVDATACPTCGHVLKPATRRPAPRSDGLLDLVVPVPGAEAMYADFRARVECGRRKVESGRKRRMRKREHLDDHAWRMAHADLDRFLAHCEVGGRILRRWATPGGGGQTLVMSLDGITPAGDWTLTADEIRYYARGIATGNYVGLRQYGDHEAEVAA